ncbi:MAG TPA: peptidase S41, partial [Thermoanaerobaculia bacterium]|nr:peptidase S41 [Thermoanaerobaculia bacterium]
MRFRLPFFLLLFVCAAAGTAIAATTASAPDIHDTRLLSEPAVSADRIAFIYANDLWTCALDGSNARRLTADVGVESSPSFSSDGNWIAFSAQYEGNIDVYVVSSDGGVPKRLTWHPGNDIANGFTPDGKSVLFTSPRNVYTARYTQLFAVPVEGGAEVPLPIPHADRAVYSPDGRRIAYNPLQPRFLQWKRYRGGTVSQVWLYDTATHAIEKIPQPASRANDAGPMWLDDTVFFRSDRDGEFNLWSYDTKSKALKRLTNHSDFPVMNASAGGGKIVYEQAGYLHLFDPASGRGKRLTVAVAADLPETRPRFVKETKDRKYIRDFSISPTGVRVALDFRGEIVTVPAEKGDVRNLTNSPGVHERSPIWSPDGRSIAYFSDESGEYELHVEAQNGKGEPKRYKLNGAGFYEFPAWSPDSKKIAYVDNSRTLYWIDVASGASRKVGSDYFYGPIKNLRGTWSPDSKWIAYAVNNQAYVERVYVYSLDQNSSFPVSDGLSDVSEPVFDKSGTYLYFFASTNAGPINNWFTLENEENRVTRSIWLAVLRKDLPNPLVKESDEEKGSAAESEKD